MNKLTLMCVTSCTAMLAGNAFSAFILIDNFSGYTDNAAVAGANGWIAGAGGTGYAAVTDPNNAANMVLDRTSGGQHGILINSTGINIPEGSSGTLFYRMLDTDANNDTFVGLQELGGNSSAIDAGLGGAALKGENSSTSLFTYPASVSLVNNLEGTNLAPLWYNIWIVAKNNVGTGDTFDVYLQGGTNYIAQTQVGTNLAAGGVAGALGELKIGVWDTRIVALDDFYADSSGVNLANPTIPEPSTFAALGGLLAVAVALLRRRISGK
ncbi:MAG: PEP-CTERM sorting domain-containing protein [Verrucomicrobiota bacterium]|nr:PEP-CTERM sorting domain-containing protein [Verrucomicrobiota bacterium]